MIEAEFVPQAGKRLVSDLDQLKILILYATRSSTRDCAARPYDSRFEAGVPTSNEWS